MPDSVCPLLDSQAREDMMLCALDALRLDGEPITTDQLVKRYGFTADTVLVHGESAIYEANRIFYNKPEGT
jgi:hypothetical protein